MTKSSDKTEKECINKTCYMAGTKVLTDKEDCIGCGRELHGADLYSKLFGTNGIDDLFRRK